MKNILALFIVAYCGMAVSENALAQSSIGGAAPKNAGMGAVSPPMKGNCLMGTCTSMKAPNPISTTLPVRPVALVKKKKTT